MYWNWNPCLSLYSLSLSHSCCSLTAWIYWPREINLKQLMSYVIVHYLGIYFFHLMIFWIINDPSGGVFWQRQTGAASHAIICVYIKCFIMVYIYIIQQDKANFYNKPIITITFYFSHWLPKLNHNALHC